MTEEYEEHYEWARQKLKTIEQSKQQTINELAQKLEQSGMPLEKICSEICRHLEGYASEQYIRKCLDPKYKEVEKRHKPKEIEQPQADEKLVSHTNEGRTMTENNNKINEPQKPQTIEAHKASEGEDEQIKQFKLESDVDKYKKESFDRLQEIEELKTQVERLTNQVNTQAEHIKENLTTGTTTQEQPKIFPFTLPEKQLYIQCPKCHHGENHSISARVYEVNTWVPYQDHTAEQKQQAQKWRNV